jgi:hypothetical protein
MCILVHHSPNPHRPWNPTLGVITIPSGLTYARSLLAVQVVLAELAIPQPPDEAVCYCGAPVQIFRVPVQRQTSEGAYVAS